MTFKSSIDKFLDDELRKFDGLEYIDEFDEESVNYIKNKLKLTLY